jgi:hypothetical protein
MEDDSHSGARKGGGPVSELRAKVMEILAGHIGRENAVGMGELYQQVYGQPWRHRINDTRPLRYLITDLRKRKVPICRNTSVVGCGYFLPAVGSEARQEAEKLKIQGLKKLAQAANIEKVSLPELLGQMRLNIEGARGKT